MASFDDPHSKSHVANGNFKLFLMREMTLQRLNDLPTITQLKCRKVESIDLSKTFFRPHLVINIEHLLALCGP